VRAGIGQSDAAAALLAEVEAFPAPARSSTTRLCSPRCRAPPWGSAFEASPSGSWAAFALRTPYDEHAVLAANAIIAAGGDLQAGVDRCAEAAERWERFGVVPEEAFAPRPGTVPRRVVPYDRGRTRAAARPRDLRVATSGTCARRDGRALPTGDRAQFVGRSWSTHVRERTLGHNDTQLPRPCAKHSCWRFEPVGNTFIRCTVYL
jgi:hypothetical protein